MALFKSRGLITGKTVCCDLTLTGQIVPVKSDSVCMVVVVVGDYLLVIISDGVMFENACVSLHMHTWDRQCSTCL